MRIGTQVVGVLLDKIEQQEGKPSWLARETIAHQGRGITLDRAGYACESCLLGLDCPEHG